MKRSLIIIFLISNRLIYSQSDANDSLVIEKLNYINNVLIKDNRACKIWWNTWLIGYTAGSVVQLGAGIATDEKPLKQDMYLGAATTILGSGFQLLYPTVKIDKKYITQDSSLTPAERIQLLFEAEEKLKQSAEYEKSFRSWQNHALTGAANIGVGLITWLAFDRTVWDGIYMFLINTAITEIQIWSTPVHAKNSWEYYQQKYISGIPGSKQSIKVTFQASAIPGGFKMRLVF